MLRFEILQTHLETFPPKSFLADGGMTGPVGVLLAKRAGCYLQVSLKRKQEQTESAAL